MKKVFKALLFLTINCSLLTLVACSEVTEEYEYDNWKERNQHFIDSIATVCNTNADGKWEKIIAYNLDEEMEALAPNNNHFVYIHKDEAGVGTYSPLFNDSIRTHYLGRLIPTNEHPEGYVFGKSYSTYVLNEATDVPYISAVRENVPGFITATQRMVEGDRWTVYIPYYLGYGETQSTGSSIPAYSTLIFDIKMARIYKFGIDNNTSWN